MAINFVPQVDNNEAYYLAQMASGFKELAKINAVEKIVVQTLKPLRERLRVEQVCIIEKDVIDWRAPLLAYLQDPNKMADHVVKFRARSYVVWMEPCINADPMGYMLGGKESLQSHGKGA
ncbi:unnamed protein product [Linum trigynum]|uniref:Uncharacterized protein n=1 Tax=Linum trigynum TaxID=586398 RepID=A0AAV2D9U1_9ROSI